MNLFKTALAAVIVGIGVTIFVCLLLIVVRAFGWFDFSDVVLSDICLWVFLLAAALLVLFSLVTKRQW